jgi:hypothetical protein
LPRPLKIVNGIANHLKSRQSKWRRIPIRRYVVVCLPPSQKPAMKSSQRNLATPPAMTDSMAAIDFITVNFASGKTSYCRNHRCSFHHR